MRVTILSKDGCTMCKEAETFLDGLNISYDVQKVDKEKLQQICGKKVSVYPQILVNGNHVGDNFSLEEYMEDNYEPLLNENNNNHTVFPLTYPNLWEIYKKHQMSNWTAEEIDLSKDMEDWNSLSKDEHHFIKHVLAFFAASDGIVFANVNQNFAQEVSCSEAKSFYAYQGHNEMVHGETYSLLIDKYITDPVEKDATFKAVSTIPCIGKKADWALKWFNKNEHSFAERLYAFMCVEGVFFSGSFCSIYWLKKRGLMPGLCFSNELISRDEAMHLEFAVELFGMLNKKPSTEVVHSIIMEAVTIEKEFILDALPCKLIGMNSDSMSQYLEFVADRLLKQTGHPTIWNSVNPFDFMENISLDGKTNFFEKRVGEYAKFSGEGEITFDEEF